jgi:hypothetical protein
VAAGGREPRQARVRGSSDSRTTKRRSSITPAGSRRIVDEDPALYAEYWDRDEVVVGFREDDAR